MRELLTSAPISRHRALSCKFSSQCNLQSAGRDWPGSRGYLAKLGKILMREANISSWRGCWDWVLQGSWLYSDRNQAHISRDPRETWRDNTGDQAPVSKCEVSVSKSDSLESHWDRAPRCEGRLMRSEGCWVATTVWVTGNTRVNIMRQHGKQNREGLVNLP